MKEIIKFELRRAVDNIGFVLALCIGIACIIYKNYILIEQDIYTNNILEKMDLYVPIRRGIFYDRWIVAYIDASVLYIFYFFGLMVTLPYGVSYFRDKKTGVIKNVVSRIDKKKYLKSKWLAVYISGGMVALIPILLDFLIVKLHYPHTVSNFNATGIIADSEWHVFMAKHLNISAIIFMAIWFVFGGALATLALLISSFCDNAFTIQLAPFLFIIVLFYLPGILPDKYRYYFPYYFLRVDNSTPIYGFLISVLMAIVTYMGFIKMELRKDVM